MTKYARTTPLYKAPEGYDLDLRQDKIDIWAGGVILYFMSSLKYPFDTDEKNPKKSKKILKEKITQVPHDEIEGRSKNMNDFINFLLNKDPNDRPSIKEVLEHPFIFKFSTVSIKN